MSSSGEGAIAAADVEPSKSFRSVEPFKECCANETAPAAHEALVGFTVNEKFFSFAHWPSSNLVSLSRPSLLHRIREVSSVERGSSRCF